MNCMMKGCEEKLTDEDVKQLLNDQKLFEKLMKFRLDKEILNSKNMKFCPEINCGGYGEKTDEENKYIICNKDHKFCFECLNNWHGKQDCNEV